MNNATLQKTEETVRERVIPVEFRKQNASNKSIIEWARNQLNGQEPDISTETFDKIKRGEINKIKLKPKKSGFFLPDGSFIETYKLSLKIGDDLDEAEREWDKEEEDRTWIDEENIRFNKKTGVTVHDMWEHGKRIIDYAKKMNRPLITLQRDIAKRSGPGGYGVYSHRTCSDFYLWKENAESNDPIFSLTWGHIDCLIKFSFDNSVRDKALLVMQSLKEKYHLEINDLYMIFGTKGKQLPETISPENSILIMNFRKLLKIKSELTDSQLSKIVAIFHG